MKPESGNKCDYQNSQNRESLGKTAEVARPFPREEKFCCAAQYPSAIQRKEGKQIEQCLRCGTQSRSGNPAAEEQKQQAACGPGYSAGKFFSLAKYVRDDYRTTNTDSDLPDLPTHEFYNKDMTEFVKYSSKNCRKKPFQRKRQQKKRSQNASGSVEFNRDFHASGSHGKSPPQHRQGAVHSVVQKQRFPRLAAL